MFFWKERGGGRWRQTAGKSPEKCGSDGEKQVSGGFVSKTVLACERGRKEDGDECRQEESGPWVREGARALTRSSGWTLRSSRVCGITSDTVSRVRSGKHRGGQRGCV